MSTRFSTKVLLAGFMLTACGASFLVGQTQPATAPAGGPVMDKPIAVINGQEVNNAFFYNALIQVAGRRVFEQIFDLTLVQGACRTEDISVDTGPLDDKGMPTTPEGKDFLKRKEDELKRIKDSIVNPDPKNPLTDKDRERILGESLARQGMAGIEFQMNLERAAGLRALAKKIGKIPDPTEDDISAAHVAQYGEKCQVRIFVIPASTNILETVSAFRKAVESGKAPEAVAAEMKLPAPTQGTISSNAKGNEIEVVREAAFSMKSEKQLSPMLTFQKQNILVYLDKKEPSTLATNPLAPLKAKITEDLKLQNENNWMNLRLNKLRAGAVFTINEPELNRQFQMYFDALRKQAEAATQAAATNPGAAPASMPGTVMPMPMPMPTPATTRATSAPK